MDVWVLLRFPRRSVSSQQPAAPSDYCCAHVKGVASLGRAQPVAVLCNKTDVCLRADLSWVCVCVRARACVRAYVRACALHAHALRIQAFARSRHHLSNCWREDKPPPVGITKELLAAVDNLFTRSHVRSARRAWIFLNIYEGTSPQGVGSD